MIIRSVLAALEIAIGEVQRDTVDQSLVTQALAGFGEAFAEIGRHQQEELVWPVLHNKILGPEYVKVWPLWATA
jgi:hypothetical protein